MVDLSARHSVEEVLVSGYASGPAAIRENPDELRNQVKTQRRIQLLHNKTRILLATREVSI